MQTYITRLALTSVIAATLVGCTSMKTMEATGGSLSDGIIELSYTRSPSETSKFDEQDALRTAIKRCKAWGFKTADAFSGVQTSCRDSVDSRCDVYMVTKKYQCIGKN
ncbi:YecR-like lipofamily protein [Shewanella eurypsychrophilus]|uniref:YecR-like lipofamily protein n=1 Tax=Shewanella eurypsychrophilus TaxID=2593656 RepID=A0ABX6V898_9GAMM|nr:MULTISPECIES: YecR family lipoprotein [Shewanella]QFU23604.1 hypothetical protein FS418_18235 [Shewanella sp. YLB-09]QPG58828.1 YecR-like lipofamily protein [Shewanella eurypsychrophilus]